MYGQAYHAKSFIVGKTNFIYTKRNVNECLNKTSVGMSTISPNSKRSK